ncbi:MAG TPA: glucose-1-phosphate thymidylyltransferase [Bacteroidetes bacterium]|nr:glucose-1-phosphate thymidylyltransferase [Bacteroidota bacterium]
MEDNVEIQSQAYLMDHAPVIEGLCVMINSAFLCVPDLVEKILALNPGESLYDHGVQVASCVDASASDAKEVEINDEVGWKMLSRPWEIFEWAGEQIERDFVALTKHSNSQVLPEHCVCIGPLDQLFIEEGAEVLNATFNTLHGPVYIGKNATVMEGSRVRGPFMMGEGSVLKMNAKIYGATVLGPHCKVGGEVSNSVFQGYSNKGHDGYLGNSVIGYWCNLGADTNTSNLKNNYSSVKVYSYLEQDYVNSNRQFVGSLMGDHCKTGINTMLNTGTVLGVNVNIVGGDFPPKFLPSFSWVNRQKVYTYRLDKAVDVAKAVMARRQCSLSDLEFSILNHLFETKQP